MSIVNEIFEASVYNRVYNGKTAIIPHAFC